MNRGWKKDVSGNLTSEIKLIVSLRRLQVAHVRERLHFPG